MAIIKPNNNTMSAVTAAGLPTLAGSNMPSGTVLQVVSARPAVQVSTTSTSFVATGTKVSITPSATSSKIWCIVTSGLFWANDQSADARGGGVTIYRAGSNLHSGQMARTYRIGATSIQTVASMSILDSPSSTSSLEYEVFLKSIWGSPTMQWNDSGNDYATITCYEIKG
jgi:hypothetical protein